MFPSNAPYSRGRLVQGLTLLFWNHYVLLAIATLATWLAAGHTMLREGHDSLPAFAVADALVQLVLAAGAAFGIWIALPLLDPRPRIRPLIGVIRAGAIGWVVATAFTLARTIGRDAAEARGTASAIEALLWATVIGVVAGYAARKGSRWAPRFGAGAVVLLLSAEVLSALFWLPPESAGGLMSPPSRGLAAFGLALAARIGAWGAGAIAVRAALLSATTAAAD